MKFKGSLILMAFLVMLMAYVPKAISATPACTLVSNQATANYSVGGVPQTPVSSAANQADFTVAAKIDISVVNGDTANVSVTPGEKKALKFTVTNNSNVTIDVALSYLAASSGTASPHSGGNDSFDGTTIAIYEDTNTNGTYNDGVDQASTSINDLAPGSSKVYFIVYNANDLTQVGGSIAVYYLIAQAKWADNTAISEGDPINVTTAMSGNAACGGGTNIAVVFADGDGPAPGTNDQARDAKHSDDGAYIVQNANITVTKSSAVYWDPVNGTSSPKFIPGAVVTYTITISNSGNADATITLSDSLATQISNGYIAFKTQFDDGSHSCAVGEGIVVDNVCKTNTNDGDNADWNLTTANTVTVTNLSVPQSQSKIVKFQVTIQ